MTDTTTNTDHAARSRSASGTIAALHAVIADVRDLDGGVQGAKLVRRLELAIATLNRILVRAERELAKQARPAARSLVLSDHEPSAGAQAAGEPEPEPVPVVQPMRLQPTADEPQMAERVADAIAGDEPPRNEAQARELTLPLDRPIAASRAETYVRAQAERSELDQAEPDEGPDPEGYVREIGWTLEPDMLEEALMARFDLDADRRIELADLAADLRREHAASA